MNFTSLPGVLGLVFLMVVAGTSQAMADDQPLVHSALLTRGMSTLAKIQKAQEEVANDAGVAAVLKSSALHQIAISNRIDTDGIETTRFQHYYGGIEVFGSQTLHHVGAAGTQVQNLLAKFDVSTQPTIAAETAASIAKSVVGAHEIRETELKVLPMGDDAARLVYFVEIASKDDQAGRTMIVDAHSGEMIANLSKHQDVTPVQVFDARFKVSPSVPCQVVQGDAPVQFNLRACMQTVVNSQARQGADASNVRALNNALRVLAYYASNFQRQSYDGRGSQIINVVHAGNRFANAFWDTETNMMAYGDGDGRVFGDMTNALDVAAHEMTHGVTNATARLIGMGEPGALNEANSDFFGKLVANDGTWAIGRGVFIRPTPGNDAIRDLANPARLRSPVSLPNGQEQTRPYPSTTAQEATLRSGCDDSNDGCNVHYNSTIPSHAMYLMAQAVGKDVAQKIQYATLTHALGPNTSFRQYGAAVRQVCAQLYDARTCQAVAQVYASVGL